jgi:hypothetical protein
MYVYVVHPMVNPNCPVVFAAIGTPRGGPDATLDCPIGKAGQSM